MTVNAPSDHALTTLQNKVFDEIAIGDTAITERTLTTEDIQLFALQSGDFNPQHIDPEFASSTRFQGVIAHGMWGGALISGVLGMKLPGPGTIYRSQTLEFLAPVRVGDTLRVSVKVIARDAQSKRINFECSCVNQDDEEVIRGEAEVIAPTERIERERATLPEVRLEVNTSDGIRRLMDHVRPMGAIRTAVVHPCNALSLSAALEARDHGLIIPILVGPRARIKAVAAEAGLDLSGVHIEDTPHSHASASAGAHLAACGQAEAIMKGSLHTDELMGAILPSAAGLRTKRRISHCYLMQTASYPRPFIITDAAITIAPTLLEKADIIRNAIDLAHAIGVKQPCVAILAAVETINVDMPATLDAAALCKMADRGQITGALLDGPLAFDNAVSPAAAAIKGIDSPVAGKADILIAPDLESGNMLAKQLEFMGNASSAGIVLGAKVPIVLTSRADTRETRIASCAIAVLLAHHYRNTPP
ncbi:bifunctional enoyl-CoA hydratase/phosphate acetyltransferase [Allopusillimonas ginsengisoli]|uniref:bifunctional enoyl-CoA hydratase/phosphate acetyltransferase n=1 Tax=Allopusillimonas ginsengisoli TaxID=453575 RepID=UPI0039C34E70